MTAPGILPAQRCHRLQPLSGAGSNTVSSMRATLLPEADSPPASWRLDRGGGRRRGSAGGRRGVFSNLIPTTPSRTTHPQRLPASPPVNDDSAGNTPGAKMSSAPAFKWRGEQHCFEYACHAPPRSRLAGGELASRSGRWAPARFSRRSEGRLQQPHTDNTEPHHASAAASSVAMPDR